MRAPFFSKRAQPPFAPSTVLHNAVKACLPYAHLAAWQRRVCKYSTCFPCPSLAWAVDALPSADPTASGSHLPRQRCEAPPQPPAATPAVQLLAGFLQAAQVTARVPVDCRQREVSSVLKICVRTSKTRNSAQNGRAAHLSNSMLLASSSRTDAHTTRGTVQRFCSQRCSTTAFEM